MRLAAILVICLSTAIGLIGWSRWESWRNETKQIQPLAASLREIGPRQLFLDAEAKLLEGKRDEAAALLSSRIFEGKAETDRLVRLAALFVVEDPNRSWEYLAEASRKDPGNIDVRIFKANVLESLNQPDLAASEQIASIRRDPDNPYLREQLADFLLRASQYQTALSVLQDAMISPSLDTIWLKTLFWSRVISPVAEADKQPPQGELLPLVGYLNSLPKGVYWDGYSYAVIPEGEKYLKTRQETFWLRLIAQLKSGNEAAALDLLNANPFQSVSWAPPLEKSLKTILTYRRMALKNPPASSGAFLNPDVGSSDKFLEILSKLAAVSQDQLPMGISGTLQKMLLSQEAFALPFLAYGWKEAALQLNEMEVVPKIFPEWVAFDFTEALQENRGNEAALKYAQAQHPSSKLLLLTAEIALEINQQQAAIEALTKVDKTDDEASRVSALLLAKIFLDQGEASSAKRVLAAQPGLKDDNAAKEMLARIALKEEDLEAAYALYASLEKESAEAKSFLAWKAFVDKDWARARTLTQELLEIYPGNQVLQENLQRILDKEKE